jgi:predicted enzyme related to lactoylglutathione lyase
MTNPHGSWLWYELITSDADGAAAFYADLIGWTFRPAGQEGMDYRLFAMAGEDVGGMMAMASDQMPPCWLGYVTVDDVDATAALVRDHGGAIHMGPQDIPGVGRFAFCADPDGAMFYIMRGSVEGGTSKAFGGHDGPAGHFAWNELAAADPARALAFYGALFGWVVVDTMDMGPAGLYQMIASPGGAPMGAIMPMQPGTPRPVWSHYVRVGSIEAAHTRVQASGGTSMMGPHEIPGGDYILIAADPQGAVFALVGAK